MRRLHVVLAVAAVTAAAARPSVALAQLPALSIKAPPKPLPTEQESKGKNRFSFIVYGDTRGPRDSTELQQAHGWVVDAIVKKVAAMAKGPDPVRFVIQTGDAVLDGRRTKMLDVGFTPLINRITTEAQVPYFFVAGNHDVGNSTNPADPWRVKGYANLAFVNRELLPPEGSPRRLAGFATYAFGYGNTFFLGFDSNIGADSTQFNWVRNQLRGLDRKRYVHVVAFCHTPAYSSGPHGVAKIDTARQAMRDFYLPLFRTYHVDLLLAGHEHMLEHYVEHYDDATGTHRLDQVVTGGGGAPIYTYRGEPELATYLRAGAPQGVRVERVVTASTDTLKDPHHYMVVHVDGDRIRVEAFGVGWGEWFMPYGKDGMVLADTGRKGK
jgi:hypothetical protein